jgi:phosphotransferase system enzyme I (PtsI)
VGSPHAYIFDAQLLMLDDPLLVDRTVAVIREEHLNAAWALRAVAEQLQGLFDEFGDAYLKERRTDLDDVLGRLQVNRAGAQDAPSLARLPRPHVLVAQEITPSEAAELDWTTCCRGHRPGLAHPTPRSWPARGAPAVVAATRPPHPGGALVVVDAARPRRGGALQPAPRVTDTQQRAEVEEQRLLETRRPAVTGT